MNTIYALIDPRGPQELPRAIVRYIGITAGPPEHRLRCHLAEAKGKRRSHRLAWIRHLSALGLAPVMLILEVVPNAMGEAHERQWIAHYRALGADLTNGNDGGCLRCQDPDVRKKIAAGRIGKKRAPHPQEMRDKISAKLRGRHLTPMTPEIRAKIAATLTGKKQGPRSAAVRQRMSEAQRGKTVSAEAREKIKKARALQVFTEEHRRTLSASLKGKPKSEAHRLAVIKANKGKRHHFANGHFRAALLPDQVREARRLRSQEGWTGPRIAQHLGVKPSVVYSLLEGRTYNHVL